MAYCRKCGYGIGSQGHEDECEDTSSQQEEDMILKSETYPMEDE